MWESGVGRRRGRNRESGGNVAESLAYTLVDLSTGMVLLGDTDEGNSYADTLLSGSVPKDVLLLTVGFTYLALDTIAVNCMMKAFLWYTDEYGCRNRALWLNHVDNAKRKCNE